MPSWDYDLIISGGGPAGIYAGRARLHAVMLEIIHGGQMLDAAVVETHPGFPEGG